MATATEYEDGEGERYRDQVARLEAEGRAKDQRILDLETDLKIQQSTVRIRDAEITELTAVLARNLTRVKAETAKAAQEVAVATLLPQQRVNQ